MKMKLQDFLQYAPLNSLRYDMGAELSASFRDKHSYVPIDLPVTEILKGVGIDVGFDDVEILPDRTFSYKGHRVILYIRDVNQHGERKALPRYHLANCTTLQTMRRNNRWARYVVANRDDGEFSVNLLHEGARALLVKLDVCQNCLVALSWQGFSYKIESSARVRFVEKFRLSEFFQKFPRDLVFDKPGYDSASAPLNDYPKNWGSISESFKRKQNYCCDRCKLSLPFRDYKYLHVHHKNGQKNDCQPSNLEALCIRCHSSESMHDHMKVTAEYRDFVQKY